MGSLNVVMLIGNLGRDVDLRYTQTGVAVARLSLATTEVYNDKAGNRQSKTEWHRVTLWGKTAENLAPYLQKGKQIYVSGRLETHEYEKDGSKRYATEIRGDRVVLLGAAPSQDSTRHVRDEDVGHGEPVAAGDGVPKSELDDSDIPF